jgi:hypothetical protein
MWFGRGGELPIPNWVPSLYSQPKKNLIGFLGEKKARNFGGGRMGMDFSFFSLDPGPIVLGA